MIWQKAERELTAWENEGCGGWFVECPITHGAHPSYVQEGHGQYTRFIKGKGRCPGLTRAAHNLMFSRMYEQDAKALREEMARL